MSRTLYALVVGIDDYPPPTPPLTGCKNDARALEALLRDRAGDALQLKMLLDAEATRAAVLDGFQSHLSQAGPDDVVLFAYSGHGSLADALPEFWDTQPDRLNETLLCHDSRTTAWDLADKELAWLIAGVADGGAHVAVWLDCCHSGSGTRGLLPTRRASADPRPRPPETFLCGQPGRPAAGRHVLMAACQPDQVAAEYDSPAGRRGAFSHFLTEALARRPRGVSYRTLFAQADARVRASLTDQCPQLEAVNAPADADDLGREFLGDLLADTARAMTVSHQPGIGWAVNAGAVHGLRARAGDDVFVLSLFPVNAPDADLTDPKKAVGTAEVETVEPARSAVTLSFQGNTAGLYRAVILRSPAPRLPVILVGPDAERAAAAAAIRSAGPHGTPSLFVREVSPGESPTLRLTAADEGYRVGRAADDRPLTAPTPAAGEAVRRLERVAKWTMACNLANPSSALPVGTVVMEIDRGDGAWVCGGDVRLEYQTSGGKTSQPQFKLRFTNSWDRPVFCALVTLSEDFEISAALLPAGGMWLEPGKTGHALDGKPVFAAVPRDYWQQGVTEYKDVVKLIVGTQPFDARLLEQPRLDLPQIRTRSVRSIGLDGSLNRLLARVGDGTRGLSGQSEEESIDDWTTAQLCFTTVRPVGSVDFPDVTGTTAMVGPGLEIIGHGQFRARVLLSTPPQATRGSTLPPPPRLLTDDPDAVRPLPVSPTRAGEPALTVLELLDVERHERVTRADPLRLRVAQVLGPGEAVLPVGFDGEFFLPLGHATGSPDGKKTDVVLEALPPPLTDKRSIKGAIRMYLYKTVGRLFGVADQYPRLAAVDWDADGPVRSTADEADVRKRVAAADRVVLLVHGILGDTANMVEGVRAMCRLRDGAARPRDPRDAVLTFDYENLNTPIADTAGWLREKLATVGLGPTHTKQLTVVAHSMGGLVSRRLFEWDAGRPAADRLVMLGTPNGGSPWPTLHAYATFALSLGMNNLVSCVWPSRILSGLVLALGRYDVTLDQMRGTSTFLTELATGLKPPVPYTLLAGNTSLPPAVLESGTGGQSRLGRLLSRLSLGNVLESVADGVFFRAPNDVACSVASMSTFPPGWQEDVAVRPVPCDHFSYFSDPAALQELTAFFPPRLG